MNQDKSNFYLGTLDYISFLFTQTLFIVIFNTRKKEAVNFLTTNVYVKKH